MKVVSSPEELRASYERIWSTTDMYETRDYYARCLDLAAASDSGASARDVLRLTLRTDINDPLFLNWPRSGTRFTADDCTIKGVKCPRT